MHMPQGSDGCFTVHWFLAIWHRKIKNKTKHITPICFLNSIHTIKVFLVHSYSVKYEAIVIDKFVKLITLVPGGFPISPLETH